MSNHRRIFIDPAWAAAEYHRRGSMQRLADIVGCSRPTIRKTLVQAGIIAAKPRHRRAV